MEKEEEGEDTRGRKRLGNAGRSGSVPRPKR